VQTLKTAVVVVLLLTITYSAYAALTAPPADLPPEMMSIVEGELSEFGEADFDLGELPSNSLLTQKVPSNQQLQDPSKGPSNSSFQSLPATAGAASSSLLDRDSATARLSDQPQSNPVPAPAEGPNLSTPSFPDASPKSSPASTVSNPPPVAAEGLRSNSTGSTSPASTVIPSIPSLESQIAPENQIASTAPAKPTAADSGYALPEVTSAPGPSLPPTAAVDPLALKTVQTALVNAIATADRQCEKDQLREALGTLSLFYGMPDISTDDHKALLPRLDFLAGEVIYSKRHLLEQPYRVTKGETLRDIAAKLDVPWELLGVINGIQDPAEVIPGTELKVIRGPFRAEVSLVRNELTLFLGELYAGRFPITQGTDPAPRPGTYVVRDKQNGRTYYPGAGTSIPSGDPRNPYGDVWIDLGEQMAIHGWSGGGEARTGCIQLRAADARDIFGILSSGSDVTILR